MLDYSHFAALAVSVQKGDDEAFAQMFGELEKHFYFVALKTVRDPDAANDIVQNAFIEIYQSIGSLQDPKSFVRWAHRIVYFQCTRYLRKETKYTLLSEESEGYFDVIEEESVEFLPGEIMQKEETRAAVVELVESLPDEQRSAILLHYFEQMSVDEIAEVMAVPSNTVKSRLNYGRSKIRKSIESFMKSGVVMMAVAPLPVLTLILREAAQQSRLSSEGVSNMWAGVTAATGVTATLSAAAVAGGAAAGSAETVATAATPAAAAATESSLASGTALASETATASEAAAVSEAAAASETATASEAASHSAGTEAGANTTTGVAATGLKILGACLAASVLLFIGVAVINRENEVPVTAEPMTAAATAEPVPAPVSTPVHAQSVAFTPSPTLVMQMSTPTPLPALTPAGASVQKLKTDITPKPSAAAVPTAITTTPVPAFEPSPAPTSKPVDAYQINMWIEPGTINVGETAWAAVQVPAELANMSWNARSSDERIALVDPNCIVYGIAPGTATITVWTDSGASASARVTVRDTHAPTVTQTPTPIVTPTITPTLMPTVTQAPAAPLLVSFRTAGHDVQALVNGGTPPYTYNWSGPGSVSSDPATFTMSLTSAGIIAVTVTDAEGKSVTMTYTPPPVSTPAPVSPLTVTFSSPPYAMGTITAYPSGGTAPYTYSATGDIVAFSSTSSTFMVNVTSGTGTITVTDANGVSVSKTINIQ